MKKIENDRVIRYVMTDHYSGSIYVEYVYGSESSENLIEIFLNGIQNAQIKSQCTVFQTFFTQTKAVQTPAVYSEIYLSV